MIAFVYVPEKNPEGLHIEGVPLADLTIAQAERLPRHILAAVAAAPFYESADPLASEDAGGEPFVPPAVVAAADRLASRRRPAVKDDAAAGAAAPIETVEE